VDELNHQPTPDTLDQATAALRDTAVPAGPPADLMAATLAAMDSRSTPSTPVRSPAELRRRKMLRYIGYGTVTAATVGLLAVAGVMWTARPAPAAEVITALDNVEKAKSYRHVTKMTFDGTTMFEMRMYKQGDRMRFEAGKDIAIVTDRKGGAVQFDHANKTVTRLDIDKLVKDTPKPSEEVKGLMDKLRDRKGEGVERVGEETLDGIVTTVYALKDVKLAGTTGDWKMWVDPKRKLPVRMEMTKGNAGAEVVLTSEYSGWNEDFDEKLFSLDVPAGYKLIEVKKEK
jgi:outer membrane lipoprotein-sorting protein